MNYRRHSKDYKVNREVYVKPESQTFQDFGECVHYGQVKCPFCGELNIAVCLKTKQGPVWPYKQCQHGQGVWASEIVGVPVWYFRGLKSEENKNLGKETA